MSHYVRRIFVVGSQDSWRKLLRDIIPRELRNRGRVAVLDFNTELWSVVTTRDLEGVIACDVMVLWDADRSVVDRALSMVRP